MTSALRAERVLRSEVPLGRYPDRVGDDLVRWAAQRPDHVFMAQRAGEGWRTVTYARALERAREIGGALLAIGGPDHPLAVIAENGIDHALVVLGALYAGIPVAPLSVNYARADADPARLRALLEVLHPAAVLVPDATLADNVARGVRGLPLLTDVAALRGDRELADAAFARIGPDTVAKILFTSGSTGTPKGVVTTHRMLCSNQTMLTQIWAERVDDPVVVDWAPWSHVASGSKIFGLVLRNGGTFYVDDGRPLPGAFDATLRNLREVAPTFYFNVPRGYQLLADAFERDEALAAAFFSRVRVLLNAGAAIHETLRARLAQLALRYAGREIPVVSCWGATETAPMATAVWGPRPAAPETIGTPVPGVEIKLAPVDDRWEMRVRGPSVTPGYWRNPDATAAAFDEEGYYKSGDAAELLDPNDPARGIVFAGRISENFKLSSGTWVNVGAVRLASVEATAPLLDDVVVAGADQEELGLLGFVNLAAARELAGLPNAERAELAAHPAVRERLRAALLERNARAGGLSQRVTRVLLLPDAPSGADGEITDKGSVNQRRVLTRRAADVARLYADPLDPEVLPIR
ncbi:MAG TPA: feruloyl-CoA synthase [Candidatus Sulfotelmatobacter sp.]|nr:feruloyl-CoA synthase [Candidatus Sulfotelmatobacter sp.]